MARKVEFVNDSDTPWELCCFGGLIVPATGFLDITNMICDAELINAIQAGGLGSQFDAEHYLKVNDVAFSAIQSTNYMSFEQDGGVAKYVP